MQYQESIYNFDNFPNNIHKVPSNKRNLDFLSFSFKFFGNFIKLLYNLFTLSGLGPVSISFIHSLKIKKN